MVSYTRHLVHLFRRAGAEYSYENRVLLDKVIRETLDMEKADADDVWERIKPLLTSPEKAGKRKEFEDQVVREFAKRLITG